MRTLSNVVLPGAAEWLVAVSIVIGAGLVGYGYALHDFESLDYPPLRGGSDQQDYNNMAYAFMKTNIPGRLVTQEYKDPFIAFSERPFGNYTRGDMNHLEQVLASKNNEEVRPSAYRPPFYSISLGTVYKIFGYDFSAARCFNIVLFAVSALFLYVLCRKFTGMMASIAAVIAFMATPVAIRMYALMLEVFITCAASLFLCCLTAAIRHRFGFVSSLALGASAGILVLSKQMFAIIVPFVWLFLGTCLLSKYRDSCANYFAGSGVLLLFVLPWVSYNVAVSGDVSLPFGTSGWHDMPSAYSASYLNGENRFVVRERIFQQYSSDHGVDIRGKKARALYGRKIFLETLPTISIGLHVDLVLYKLRDALTAGNLEWAIRIMAVIAVLVLLASRKLNTEHVAMLIFAGLHLLIVALTFSGRGRLIVTVFPVALVFFAIGLETAFYEIKRKAPSLTKGVGQVWFRYY